jgi:hypothetical protein
MPYAIANTAEINGKNVKFYTQGVSLKTDGNKVEPKYKNDNPALPPTEQIKVQGKETTSRDKRLDFLYEEFVKHFTPSTATPAQQTNTESPKIPTVSPSEAFEPATNYKEEEHDDLPFN